MTPESTQAIPSGGQMIPAPQPAARPDATQMGSSVSCPVCRTANTGLETYCTECGFLLASTPGEATASQETPSPELIETGSGRRFALKAGENTVGRENCDVLVMDPTVSRRHARIDVGPGGVSVTDLGSSNGTHVDTKRLDAQQAVGLPENATVRFGNTSFTIVGVTVTAKGLLPAPAPAPAEPVVLKGVLPAAPAAAPPPAPTPSDAPSAAAPVESPVARLKPAGPNTQEVLIAAGKTTIGRRAGNTVILNGDPYISGHHAEVLSDATGCYLTDVGSTNGSVVNGERMEPGRKQLLLDGDEVKLGQTSFVFETLEGPPADTAGGPIRMGGAR